MAFEDLNTLGETIGFLNEIQESCFGVPSFYSVGLEARKHLMITCSFDFLAEWM